MRTDHYRYRELPEDVRQRILEQRRGKGFPLHSPPHIQVPQLAHLRSF